MYYTVELMNAEDFVNRIEEDCRQRREAEEAENLRKQNRSPEGIAQLADSLPKTAEPEKPI